MQLSRDTKRFFLLLSVFTVALVLCVDRIVWIIGWLKASLLLLSPFVVGACIAFIISVPMRLFHRMLSKQLKSGRSLVTEQTRKPLSMVLSILLLLLLIVLFGMIVVPQLVDTVASLAGSVMYFVPTAQVIMCHGMKWMRWHTWKHRILRRKRNRWK